MLRSDLWDYSDSYIVVKGRISVTGINAAKRRNKKLTFRNNASFRSCISERPLDLEMQKAMQKILRLLRLCITC